MEQHRRAVARNPPEQGKVSTAAALQAFATPCRELSCAVWLSEKEQEEQGLSERQTKILEFLGIMKRVQIP